MAPFRRSRASTDEGRFLAARIADAKRRGATNAEIGVAFGINPRTVRKIRSGESSGRRTFGRLVEPSQRAAEHLPPGASPSIVRVDLKFTDTNGTEAIRTVNARVPTVRTRSGKLVAATPADIFRIPNFATLVNAEAERLARQYGFSMDPAGATIRSMRPIAVRRKPLRIAISGRSA